MALATAGRSSSLKCATGSPDTSTTRAEPSRRIWHRPLTWTTSEPPGSGGNKSPCTGIFPMHTRSRVPAPCARQNGKTGHIWVRTPNHPDPSDYADFPPSMSGCRESLAEPMLGQTVSTMIRTVTTLAEIFKIPRPLFAGCDLRQLGQLFALASTFLPRHRQDRAAMRFLSTVQLVAVSYLETRSVSRTERAAGSRSRRRANECRRGDP